MSKKTFGIVVAIVGVLILAVSLLADVLGMGKYRNIFGTKQIIGAVGGALLALLGGYFIAKR